MGEIVVTDTHALIWFALGRFEKLGRAARRMYERVDGDTGVVYVPTLVLVEIGEAIHRGRFRTGGGLAEWGDGLLSSPAFIEVDLTWPIVRRAEELLTIPERRDRLIAATALEMGVPLITRDPEIAAPGLEVIW